LKFIIQNVISLLLHTDMSRDFKFVSHHKLTDSRRPYVCLTFA